MRVCQAVPSMADRRPEQGQADFKWHMCSLPGSQQRSGAVMRHMLSVLVGLAVQTVSSDKPAA